MKAQNVLFGVLAGIATGALLGILFAPAKGSRTRRQILRKSRGYADDAKDQVEEALDAISEKYESLLRKSNDFISNGKKDYDETRLENKNTIK